MGTVLRLEDARWRHRDHRAIMGAELQRIRPPDNAEERRELARRYQVRAEELEATADEVILLDTQSTLLGLARKYRHLSALLGDFPESA